MLKHLELFAGIGGFRQAIELLGNDFSIENNCVGFSEIDPFATKTYKANFNIENEVEIGDIINFTSDKKNIEALEDFNILTGGFPCQSFSMMGQKKVSMIKEVMFSTELSIYLFTRNHLLYYLKM